MVAKKQPQIPPYEAFGNELSPAVSFLQAACLLDITAGLAVESRDTETLLNVSAMWMKLAEELMGPSHAQSADEEEEEPTELGSTPRQPVGFASATKILELEEEDE